MPLLKQQTTLRALQKKGILQVSLLIIHSSLSHCMLIFLCLMFFKLGGMVLYVVGIKVPLYIYTNSALPLLPIFVMFAYRRSGQWQYIEKFIIYFLLLWDDKIMGFSLINIPEIAVATSITCPRADVTYCIHALNRRLSKTRNWIVSPLSYSLINYSFFLFEF